MREIFLINNENSKLDKQNKYNKYYSQNDAHDSEFSTRRYFELYPF